MLYALLIGERGPGLAGWLAYSGASRCGSHGVYNSVLPEMHGSDRSIDVSVNPIYASLNVDLQTATCTATTASFLSTIFLVGLQASISSVRMECKCLNSQPMQIESSSSTLRFVTISTRYIIMYDTDYWRCISPTYACPHLQGLQENVDYSFQNNWRYNSNFMSVKVSQIYLT